MQKIENLSKEYQGDPALFFYAVGKNVLLEFFRSPKTVELSPLMQQEESSQEISVRSNCLLICLQTLTDEQRQLIIDYYGEEKKVRINQRKLQAQKLDISPENLRKKVFKIKNSLQKCVLNCIKRKKA